MRQGTPLTDADRRPWLAEIARMIATWRQTPAPGIVACSALRRDYRQLIAAGGTDVRFVYLRGDFALISQRLTSRQGHFMPASLLESQFETLEEPGDSEPAITLEAGPPAHELVEQVIARLELAPRAGPRG
jgi:carbohydrate kinase (thermoresistant glucokinase family)